MKKLALVAFLFGMFGLITAVQAADKDEVTGTWKIKTKFGEKEIERTLKLENKDGKVTGTISGFGGKNAKDTAIEDGKFKDGELTFNTTRTGGKDKDQKFVSKYSAKISGDTIKGTVTSDFGGKENKSDFEGKKEAKKD